MARAIDKKVDYVMNSIMKSGGTEISICVGKLTAVEKKELSKYFILTREVFGYWNFKLKGGGSK